jgi:hypothetical protein
MADRDLMPDVWDLAGAVGSAFEELKAAAPKRPPSKAKKAPAKRAPASPRSSNGSASNGSAPRRKPSAKATTRTTAKPSARRPATSGSGADPAA